MVKNNMDTWSIGSIIFTVFLVLFGPILLGSLHWIIFKKHPFGNIKKDIQTIHECLDYFIENSNNERAGSPDDYYDYDDDTIRTNTGATIRHPKNRDRAYSGGAERFHHGGR